MEFVAHPPERRRSATTLLAVGCCCCCCCCVHSVGGLAGAIYGSIRRGVPLPETLVSEEQLREETEVSRAGRYAVRLYWLNLAILATLTIAISVAANPREKLIGVWLIVGCLPVGQLAASIVSTIYVRWRPPERQDVVLQRLGKITTWAVLGAIIGIAGTIISFYIIDKL